jgi:2-phosphosulfolactate phosphatase
VRIEVVPTVEEIRFEQIRNRVVVVIDVLRASSSIVTALACGFREVIPVETIGQANALRSDQVVLSGERHSRKIVGFDYDNSPTALSNARQPGKQLVLTTTNGTRAIQKAERAPVIVIGCFLNATACMTYALIHSLEITLYCAGTRGQFALEDGLAAGLMIGRAKQAMPSLTVCDLGKALQASYLHLADQLTEQLMQSTTGRRLVQNHFHEDIPFCSQVDRFALVPVVQERRILPRLVS